MGQIEWAMWANEQALAAGLSECGVAVRGRIAGRQTGTAGRQHSQSQRRARSRTAAPHRSHQPRRGARGTKR